MVRRVSYDRRSPRCPTCRATAPRRRIEALATARKAAATEIRAGLVCEVCGVPLQARRTTAKFWGGRPVGSGISAWSGANQPANITGPIR
jgi:hypothetical protein